MFFFSEKRFFVIVFFSLVNWKYRSFFIGKEIFIYSTLVPWSRSTPHCPLLEV